MQNLRAGVIGLGMIGGGIAVSLARRGRVPAVHDVRSDAASTLAGVPDPLPSPAAVAAASDVVFVAVVDAAQVETVVTGEDGLLAGAHPGLVIAVTATIPVQVIARLAEQSAARGAALIDCGVNRGTRAAENGLLLYVGGPEDVIARVRPVFDDIADEVLVCGPLGAGMALKLAVQVVSAGKWRAVHEAVAIAGASGVDPATVVAAIEGADPDGSSLLRLQRLRMQRSEFDEFSRPLWHYRRNLNKDLKAVKQLATATGVAVPLVDVVREQAADTFAWIEMPAGSTLES